MNQKDNDTASNYYPAEVSRIPHQISPAHNQQMPDYAAQGYLGSQLEFNGMPSINQPKASNNLPETEQGSRLTPLFDDLMWSTEELHSLSEIRTFHDSENGQDSRFYRASSSAGASSPCETAYGGFPSNISSQELVCKTCQRFFLTLSGLK